MSTNSWIYKGEVFASEMIGDYVGFVYLITELSTDRKYVGKKLFRSTHKLPPLKGKKRKRIVVKESDWQTYSGSNEELKMLVEEKGREKFRYEILHLCNSKGEMSYIEAKEQFDRDVLLRDDYWNGIINCKIHKTHVSKLKNENEEIQRTPRGTQHSLCKEHIQEGDGCSAQRDRATGCGIEEP